MSSNSAASKPQHQQNKTRELCHVTSQEPAEAAAEEVHGILRQVVGMVLSSAACEALQRFPALQREIAGAAAGALAEMRGEKGLRFKSYTLSTSCKALPG